MARNKIALIGSGMIGATADRTEGVAAFLEKRPPNFGTAGA